MPEQQTAMMLATPLTPEWIRQTIRAELIASGNCYAKVLRPALEARLGRPLAKKEWMLANTVLRGWKRECQQAVVNGKVKAEPLPRLTIEYGRLFEEVEQFRRKLAWFSDDLVASVMRRRQVAPATPAEAADLRSEERNYMTAVREMKGMLGLIKDTHKVMFDAQRTVKMQDRVLDFFREKHPELAEEFATWLAEAGL